ncbi:MAG: hypothetical protein RMY34_05970 [Aulosira sp. DedQUE10]|nr:hypothetical protein [Aulosira sp. DedQUE10]
MFGKRILKDEVRAGQGKQEAQVITLSRLANEDAKELVNSAKLWDNLTATPALFDGLLLYSSEQGGGYAVEPCFA